MVEAVPPLLDITVVSSAPVTLPTPPVAVSSPIPPTMVSDGWTAPRRSARAVNPNYVHGEMPPLHLKSAHIGCLSPSYDGLVGSLRSDHSSSELHSAAVMQASVPVDCSKRSRHYRRNLCKRSCRSSRVVSSALVADTLSTSDLALLEPHLQATRDFWSNTVPVQREDELDYSAALCYLASDDPLLACMGTLPVPSSELIPIPSLQCKEVPLRTAFCIDGAARLRTATTMEVDKNF